MTRRRGYPPLTNEQIFERRIAVDENGCWIWQGQIAWNGYGRFHSQRVRSTTIAHRVIYTLFVGPIPDGLDLDHRCRVRACVNPSHLEPVTRAQNLQRSTLVGGWQRRKTHCINGHEFTPENTYLRKDRPSHRGCRACRTEASRRYHERKGVAA